MLTFFGASRVTELNKLLFVTDVLVNFCNRIFLNSSLRNTVCKIKEKENIKAR